MRAMASSRGGKKMWCVPRVDEEFVERMEGEDPFTLSVRFRTVGDMSCTGAVASTAATLEAVVAAVQKIRAMDLRKPPSVSYAQPWKRQDSTRPSPHVTSPRFCCGVAGADLFLLGSM